MKTMHQQQPATARWQRVWILIILLLGMVWGAGDRAYADEALTLIEQIQALPWITGPAKGKVAGVATITFGDDYMFLESAGTKRFLELNGNLPTESAFALAKKDLSWFAVFHFDASGYVKDDETIDPDALLKQLQANNRAADEERMKRGLQSLTLEGWFVPLDTMSRPGDWNGARVSR